MRYQLALAECTQILHARSISTPFIPAASATHSTGGPKSVPKSDIAITQSAGWLLSPSDSSIYPTATPAIEQRRFPLMLDSVGERDGAHGVSKAATPSKYPERGIGASDVLLLHGCSFSC